MGAAEIARYRHEFTARPHEPAVAKIGLLFAEARPDTGNDEENAENVEDEMKAGDEGNAQPDHNAAHD